MQLLGQAFVVVGRTRLPTLLPAIRAGLKSRVDNFNGPGADRSTRVTSTGVEALGGSFRMTHLSLSIFSLNNFCRHYGWPYYGLLSFPHISFCCHTRDDGAAFLFVPQSSSQHHFRRSVFIYKHRLFIPYLPDSGCVFSGVVGYKTLLDVADNIQTTLNIWASSVAETLFPSPGHEQFCLLDLECNSWTSRCRRRKYNKVEILGKQ